MSGVFRVKNVQSHHVHSCQCVAKGQPQMAHSKVVGVASLTGYTTYNIYMLVPGLVAEGFSWLELDN